LQAAFQNTACKQTESDIVAWLDSYRLLLTQQVRDKMNRLEASSFGKFVAPVASAEYAALMGKFFALFVLVDDQLVEPMYANGQARAPVWEAAVRTSLTEATRHAGRMPVDRFLEQHAALLHIKAPQEMACECRNVEQLRLAPYARAWFDLCAEWVTRGASRAWQARMASAVDEYIAYGIRESRSVQQLQTQWISRCGQTCDARSMSLLSVKHVGAADPCEPLCVADPAADRVVSDRRALLHYIFRQRIPAIGVPMFALLLERASGLDMEAAVASESVRRACTELVNLCAVPCFLVNDMFGLARDIQRAEHCFNDMLLSGTLYEWLLVQSIDFAVHLHDDCVAEIVDACAHLVAREPRLATYLASLRMLVRGYGQWHAHCLRYVESTAMCAQDQRSFVFAVQDLNEALTPGCS
jgi:hypothetical protein